MKTRLLSAAFSIATTITLFVPALAAETAQVFVTKATAGGIFEVESSKIYQRKTTDQDIKNFSQMMIRDHGAANAKLETIAAEQKLQVPADLDAAHKSKLEALRTNNSGLDQNYVEMQRDAHSDAIVLFESYAKEGDNTPLKAFAGETLPTLKAHQVMIEKIAASMEEKSSPAVTTTDTPNASTPVPGANSFTEAQAKSRIEEAGYSEVSALAKDDQGIWRAKANKNGNSVSVALDYQGNVVANSEAALRKKTVID